MKKQKLDVYQAIPFLPGYHRLALWSIAWVLCVLGLSNHLDAREAEVKSPVKTMTAMRINPHPPKIDGILDDSVWQHTPTFTGFTQQEPKEGEPATELTTIQVVYDDEALYIGVMVYDQEPDKIVARLTRRDGWTEADWVSVHLDPYHDHQTGNFFYINAAGALGDGTLYNDTQMDSTWNGVWEARAAIHDQCWTAEYKIPYHLFVAVESQRRIHLGD